MRVKQLGSMHITILIAILAVTVIGGLGVIVMLDKSMIARTVTERRVQNDPTPTSAIASETTQEQQQPTMAAAKDADLNAKKTDEQIRRALSTGSGASGESGNGVPRSNDPLSNEPRSNEPRSSEPRSTKEGKTP